MSRASQRYTLFRSRDLVWVRESKSTIVIDREKDQVHILQGLDGMVWSWLTLGYDFSKLTGLLACALDLPPVDAELRLTALFHDWMQMGLLVQEDAVDG
jgi:hypothetical protein